MKLQDTISAALALLTLVACQGNASGADGAAGRPGQTAAQTIETQGSGSGPAVSPPIQPQPAPAATAVIAGDVSGNVGPQTAEGAALQGMSQVVSAAGQYNLATSAAAINMTQAQSDEMRVRIQSVETFYALRAVGRALRESERGPRPTPEELARRARAGAPRPLDSSQVDPVSGVLFWPLALQDASFETQRVALQEYVVRWMKYGALDYAEQGQVRENIDAMFDTLKSQIASMSPQDYVECRVYLQSLLYATTRSML